MYTRASLACAVSLLWATANAQSLVDGPDAKALTATFVFIKGATFVSRCDGSMPTRVAISDAYSEVASVVEPVRLSRLNAAVLTVVMAPAAPPSGLAAEPAWRVLRVMEKGPMVECNVTAGHRPMVGTRWVQADETPRAPAKAPPGARRAARLWFQLGSNGQFRGDDGCNRLWGKYELKPAGELVFSEVAMTQVACRPQPPAIPFGNNRVEVNGRWLTLSPPGLTFVADDDVVVR